MFPPFLICPLQPFLTRFPGHSTSYSPLIWYVLAVICVHAVRHFGWHRLPISETLSPINTAPSRSPHPLQAADVDDTALFEPGLASGRVGKKGIPYNRGQIGCFGWSRSCSRGISPPLRGMTNVVNPPLVNMGHQYGDANTSGRLGGYMAQAPFISGRSKTTTNAEEPTSGYDEQEWDGGNDG
jgi:hypothetical protein